MRIGKAPGPDNLPVELWKVLGDEGASIVTILRTRITTKIKYGISGDKANSSQ